MASWIKKAIKKPGALHKQLGVPQGEKIPEGKLDKAADAKGKLGKRARLAETLAGFAHKREKSKSKKSKSNPKDKEKILKTARESW